MTFMDGTRLSLASRLKARTTTLHESLDDRVMALRPFESRNRYARFLRTQHAFFREIECLYCDPSVAAIIPDIRQRSRLVRAQADLRDLGLVLEGAGETVRIPSERSGGLGWLYVAEGSKLGAAFLLKQARQLGLHETSGARHLAAPPEGRGHEWRSFVSCLDAMTLSSNEENRAMEGARAAFARFAHLLELMFAESDGVGSPAIIPASALQPQSGRQDLREGRSRQPSAWPAPDRRR